MSLWDALFGRTRLKRPNMDDLFALATAAVTLEVEVRWQPAGRAGVCLKPVTSGDFAAAEAELRELVQVAARDSGTRVEVLTDAYRFRWLLLADPDFEDLVTLVHLIGRELEAHGYGAQLLSAVFRFQELALADGAVAGSRWEQPPAGPGSHGEQPPSGPGRACYLIYNYKRGNFYPFCPTGKQRRDHAAETRAAALMEQELPMEKDLTRWFPIWDCPV